MNNLDNVVYNLVQKIPEGYVTTYGAIAKKLGLKTPRQVGWILHRNPDSSITPCHRVVFSDGSLTDGFAFGGREEQRMRLLDEGVEFDKNGKVKKERLLRDL